METFLKRNSFLFHFNFILAGFVTLTKLPSLRLVFSPNFGGGGGRNPSAHPLNTLLLVVQKDQVFKVTVDFQNHEIRIKK